jgi:hypothetical protein
MNWKWKNYEMLLKNLPFPAKSVQNFLVKNSLIVGILKIKCFFI